MATTQLSQQDFHDLDRLLHENGDRTAFYLHYYELTGNKDVLDMAQISHFSGFKGGAAEYANGMIHSLHPDTYPQGPVDAKESPTGGVKVFSEEVAQSLFDHIKDDLEHGSGTGILSGRQVLEAARAAWEANGLGNWFPGDIEMKGEILTWGSGVAGLSGALESVFGGYSRESAYESALASSSYHVTEDGKVGFFVDRETGHVGLVVPLEEFPMPSKADWAGGIASHEPHIESRGVLDSVPDPEMPAPLPRDVYPTPEVAPATVVNYPSVEPPSYGYGYEYQPPDFVDGLLYGAVGGSLLNSLTHPAVPEPIPTAPVVDQHPNIQAMPVTVELAPPIDPTSLYTIDPADYPIEVAPAPAYVPVPEPAPLTTVEQDDQWIQDVAKELVSTILPDYARDSQPTTPENAGIISGSGYTPDPVVASPEPTLFQQIGSIFAPTTVPIVAEESKPFDLVATPLSWIGINVSDPQADQGYQDKPTPVIEAPTPTPELPQPTLLEQIGGIFSGGHLEPQAPSPYSNGNVENTSTSNSYGNTQPAPEPVQVETPSFLGGLFSGSSNSGGSSSPDYGSHSGYGSDSGSGHATPDYSSPSSNSDNSSQSSGSSSSPSDSGGSGGFGGGGSSGGSE